MEPWVFAISTIGVLLTMGGFVATGVWCVSRISGSVDSLGVKVDGLGGEIGALSKNVKELDDKLDGHDQRITRVETRMEGAV